MKKYISFLAAWLLLHACTLSMDEWVVPEEDFGKEEPHTVENEYGSITYQFRDSVVFFTENLQQQFLVRTEADSILFISGAIPDKWRPYVGQKMAAGISHELPYGLNNRVVAVENQGGIYRVVTTRVAVEEVYKTLNYCFDSGISTPDLNGLSEEELADLGYEMTVDPETGDTVYQDWNDYDIAHGLRPAEARRSSLKRAMARRTRGEDEGNDEDKPKDGSVDGHKDDGIDEKEGSMQDWEKDEMFKVGWDTRKEVGDGRITFGPGKASEHFGKALETMIAAMWAYDEVMQVGGEEKRKFYTAGAFTWNRYQKVHARRDESEKIEEEWTDTYSELELALEFGLHKPGGEKNSNKLGKNLAEVVENTKFASKYIEALKEKKKLHAGDPWDKAKIRIILCVTPIPIAIVAGGKIEPIVELNGFGSLSGRYISKVTRAGCITKNGKQHPIRNEEVEYDGIEPGFHFDGFCLNGSIKVGVSARVYGGFEFAGTASATVGLNTEAYFEGKCSFNLSNMIADDLEGKDHVQYNNINGSLGFTWKIFGDFTVQVAPLGLKVWEDKFPFKEKILYQRSFLAGPNVEYVNGYINAEEDSEQIVGTYRTSDMDGFFAWSLIHVYYAGMKCYFGPIADNKYEYMEYTDMAGKTFADVRDYKAIDEEKDYYFIWKGSIKKKEKEIGKQIKEVHLVPVIYYVKGIDFRFSGIVDFKRLKDYITTDEELQLTKHEIKVEAGDPEITTRMSSQISAKEISPGRREIKFYSLVDVHTAGQIKDWGVTVYIYDHNKQLIRPNGNARGRTVRPKKGLRSGAYYFVFTFETDWSEYVSYADKNGNPVTGRDIKMYYRIIPFWNAATSNAYEMEYVNATDHDSKKYYELEFEKEDKATKYITKNSKSYGWTVTETNLNN